MCALDVVAPAIYAYALWSASFMIGLMVVRRGMLCPDFPEPEDVIFGCEIFEHIYIEEEFNKF